MTVLNLIEQIKKLPKKTIIVVLEGAENENGKLLPSGLGYLDSENNEYVYIGEIEIITDED